MQVTFGGKDNGQTGEAFMISSFCLYFFPQIEITIRNIEFGVQGIRIITKNFCLFLKIKDKKLIIPNTITCLINEKGQINQNAHTSNVHPAHFEPNKRASRANRYEIA